MEHTVDEKTLRKWQYLQLKILLEFDRVCRKNNIAYNLAGGTLIGAVRHKGFIPWDDDIDVAMMGDEYERFMQACKTDLNPAFFLQCPETDPQFPCGAKLMLKDTTYITNVRPAGMAHNGIFIDILDYTNIPDSNIKKFFFCNWYHVIKRIYIRRYGFKPHPKRFYQRAVLNFFDFLYKPFSTERIKRKFNTYCAKYNGIPTKEVTILGGAWGYKKEKHLRETVTHFIDAEFEGHRFMIPRDYDLLLSEQYGDYMKLPPKEEQVLRHTYKVLDFGMYEEEAEAFFNSRLQEKEK